MTAPAFRDLLVESRADLVAWVGRHAGRVLRYESADDLVQAIHVRALEHEADFRWRGREPFFAWLHQVARTCLADRHAHWAALRRRPSRLVRLTRAGSTSGAAEEPRAPGPGPSTVASRREDLVRAVRVLDLLLPRDRDLVTWTAEDVDADEQARRLGISRDAAERARRRALERFRKAYELASRS